MRPLLLLLACLLALTACDSGIGADAAAGPAVAEATAADISGPVYLGLHCEGTFTLSYMTAGSFTIESGNATIVHQTSPSTVPHVAQIRSNANNNGTFVIGFRQAGTGVLLTSLTVSQPSTQNCISGPTTLGELCSGTYTNGYTTPQTFTIESGNATILSQTPATQVPHVAQIQSGGGRFVIGLYKGAQRTAVLTVNGSKLACG